MRILSAVFCAITACSTHHLEGFDRFQEVCASESTLFELGNTNLMCDAPAGAGGQLRLQMNLPDPLQIPFQIEAKDLNLGEWCASSTSDCIAIASGTFAITAYEEGIAASGHYDFVLTDGSEVAGELAAQFCDSLEGC